MASHNGANFATESPFAPPYEETLNDLPSKDSEEWEYEYSTTETETYYVTLDLTTSITATQRRARLKRGLGDKEKQELTGPRWVSSGLGLVKRRLDVAPKIGGSKEDGEAQADLQEQEEEEEEEERDDAGDMKETLITAESGNTTKPTEVQILDLDTTNPVVSYGGQIYSCRWEKNIGTELLFTKHDPEDPLPALRSLPKGIDLLAASSARIVSQPTRLEAKAPTRSTSYAHRRPPRGSRGRGRVRPPRSRFRIPVGEGANQKRKDQAQFLESMGALKHNKGEQDAVTVIAAKRKGYKQWARFINEQRAEERQRLKKAASKSGRKAEEARARMAEMDEEDEIAVARIEAVKRPNRATTRKPVGRRKKHVIERTGSPLRTASHNHSPQRSPLGYTVDGTVDFNGYEDDMSTPTPERWSDLEQDMEGVHQEGFYNEEEYYANNGEMYIGNADVDDGLYDEDAPGEVDDTLYEWQ